mgnify:CR=1 FL=1
MNHFNPSAAQNHVAATNANSNGNSPAYAQKAELGTLALDDLRRLVAAMVD